MERCGVVLSRLIGLSKYYRYGPVLGLETKELKECVEVVDCLNILAHKVLIHCNREFQEFCAFSKWLRHEIDLHAADPLSATAEEEMEKSDEIDYTLTLSYIRGAMTKSALHSFIKPTPSVPRSQPADISNTEVSFYEPYKRLLKQHEQQKPGEVVPLPTLGDLIAHLHLHCGRVFRRIADTQKRGILHRCPLSLSADCDEDVIEIREGVGVGRLLTQLNASECRKTDDRRCRIPALKARYRLRQDRRALHINVRTLSRKERPLLTCIVYIYTVRVETVNGISSTKSISVTAASLQSGRIKCIKSVFEDNALMMLWEDAGKSF